MMFGSETGSNMPLVRIDNPLAEKELSTIYHTIIETCKLAGKSPKRFSERFFQEINTGRTDYQNLLPMTIGGGDI